MLICSIFPDRELEPNFEPHCSNSTTSHCCYYHSLSQFDCRKSSGEKEVKTKKRRYLRRLRGGVERDSQRTEPI
jgi:hypothetical protein